MSNYPKRDPDKKYSLTENPALNPVRQWNSSMDVYLEMRLLLSSRTPDEIRLLKTLHLNPSHVMTNDENDVIVSINKNANSFGFIPLINVDGQTCRLTEGAHEPLGRALVDEKL